MRIPLIMKLFLLLAIVGFIGCKETKYEFGSINTPTDVVLTTEIVGGDSMNPTGDGSGKVLIHVSGKNVLTYKIDFGDGKSQILTSDSILYRYTTKDTNNFNITLNAVGTAGATASTTTKVRVFVNFQIPADILSILTGATVNPDLSVSVSSKTWVVAGSVDGFFGVGNPTKYFPDYYAAPGTPNSRQPCFYTDQITFSSDVNGNVTMANNNAGQSFIISVARPYYGLSAGADNCENVANVSNPVQLAFSNTATVNLADVSTNVQFFVPGPGILTNGTGSSTYEILSIKDNQLSLRNIGADANAWYQILQPK